MFARFARLLDAARRFQRTRMASVSIEFGFVAVPFFFLTFGLAEIAMLGLAQSSLNFAVAEVGREVRTGEAQLQGMTASQFSQAICVKLNRFLVMSCEDTLYVDVDRFDSFVDVSAQQVTPINNGDIDATNFGYNPGGTTRSFFQYYS